MLSINGDIYNQYFREVYGKYLMEDPWFSKVDIIEAARKGYAQFPVDTSTYTLGACCSQPTDSAITLKETYVACVSNSKIICKSDLNILDNTVSVRAGEGSVGTAGEALARELALNFKLGLSNLAINGNTTLGIDGLLSIASGTATGQLNNIFDAVLNGFQALPTNSLGNIGVFISPQNFNKLKVELINKNLPLFNVNMQASNMSFIFPGLDIEIISMSGIPNNRIIVTPLENVVRFAGRIDDDDFISSNFDPVGNVVFNISTLFGISLKYNELAVVVSLT